MISLHPASNGSSVNNRDARMRHAVRRPAPCVRIPLRWNSPPRGVTPSARRTVLPTYGTCPHEGDAGQGHVLTAIVLPVALSLFMLLVVNLIGVSGDILVIRGGLMLAVQDGANMLDSEGTSRLYGLADTTAVRQVVDTVARENLDAHSYDPSLLDGALASGCETGGGPCIYTKPATGCGQTDPLTDETRCGPFVSLRVTIPVRMPLGGHVSRTFHVVSGARVTRSGDAPSGRGAPAPLPATPTPVEGGVGW